MLGRRRRDMGANGTAVADIGAQIPGQGGGGHDTLPEFRLSQNLASYPSTHPRHPGYQIFFSFNNGGEVTVATPEHPAATSPVFWLVDLEVGQWTRLVDPDGRPIPVELCQRNGLGSARWL